MPNRPHTKIKQETKTTEYALKRKKKRQREVFMLAGKKKDEFLTKKKKGRGEMLLLALYKSRRHSNTLLLLLNRSIWLSLKAWILPNDETFGAVMLVAEYWTYRLYMMFIIIKLKLTQLYICNQLKL